MKVTMQNMFDLAGKCAIVTGGSSGIGLGIAEGLLEADAKVALVAENDAVYTHAERLQKEGYDAHPIKIDLMGGEEAVKDLMQKALALFDDKVDILVNAAGRSGTANCEEFPTELYDKIMDLNLKVVFLLCREVGAHMIAHGTRGKIINIASMNAFFGGFDTPAYSASKGGVAQLTKTLANAWMRYGINVNAFAPGWIKTGMTAPYMDQPGRYDHLFERLPAGRWGEPSDFKGPAVFFASAASDYLSGVILPVDGGYLVR
jgi:2-deoxy-D-gluconate 3-dehydrogenase